MRRMTPDVGSPVAPQVSHRRTSFLTTLVPSLCLRWFTSTLTRFVPLRRRMNVPVHTGHSTGTHSVPFVCVESVTRKESFGLTSTPVLQTWRLGSSRICRVRPMPMLLHQERELHGLTCMYGSPQ